MTIPASFVQELLARLDVVEVVGRYVPLKKAGANFQGLCPFHNEKSPSFSVSPSKQFYHCFGCGKSGDAIRFLMEHLGLSFVDAVGDLAGSLGLTVPDDERSPLERQQAAAFKDRQTLLIEALEKAAKQWRDQLKNSPRAIAYLQKRGLSGQIAKQYGLGYAPEGWRNLANIYPDYSDPLLVEAGLVRSREGDNSGSGAEAEEKRYDYFRDRIMFPIRNVKGHCIGFGGRVLDQGEPKYLNSPETPVFSKGREIYGLFEGRSSIDQAGYVLVCEGYMDVVALAQMGFGNAVATLGTACTAEHIQKLFRFTQKIVFSFDGDAAGRRAARKALDTSLPFASDTRSLQFLYLPPEHDPDSYIREHGADAFSRYVADATPLSQMLLDSARENCDTQTVEGRSQMASLAKPLWTALPDGATKRQILKMLAVQIQLGEHELLELWQVGTPPKPKARFQDKKDFAGKSAGKSGFEQVRKTTTPLASLRAVPGQRVDRALGILFSQPALWQDLSMADHEMLSHWQAPYGTWFAWLEAYVMEHGAPSYSVLDHALHTLDGAAAIRHEVAKAGLDDAAERSELQDILERMRKEHKDHKMRELAQAALTDPAIYEAYKRLLNSP